MHAPPPLIYAYWVFCAVSGIAMIAATALFGWGSLQPIDPSEDDVTRAELVFYTLLSAIVTAMFLAGPFIPRSKLAWMWGLTLIVLVMSTICCSPPALALMIFWLKPEMRAWIEGRPLDPTQPLPKEY